MSELAEQAAEHWYAVAEIFARPNSAFRPLRIRLKELIGGGAELGIAVRDGDPVVVLLHADRLTVAVPADPGSEHSPIGFDSMPLSQSTRVDLVIGEAQLPEGIFKTKLWTLGGPAGAALVLETRSRTSRLAPQDIGGEALLARAAIRLGWPGKGA